MTTTTRAPVHHEDTVVTGLGLVAASGIGVEAGWNGLLEGRPTATHDPLLAGMPVDFSCRVPGFDGADRLGHRLARRLDRGTQLALVAVHEALADAGLDHAFWEPARVAVVLGVGSNSLQHYPEAFGRLAAGQPQRISPLMITRSVPSMVPAEIALQIDARGPNLAVSTACSSGTAALGVARDLLRGGSCDIAVCGGAEATHQAIYSATFGQIRALSTRKHDPAGASRPFDRDRDGFVLAEGAGVLVLERAGHAAGRGARVRARLAGFGSSCDAYHSAAPHPDGRGAVQAIRGAIRDAGLVPEEIGHVNAHGTSTPLNDTVECRALREVFRHPPAVTAPKSVLGHALGAAGGIEAVCSVLTLERHAVPPTANLDCQDPDIDLDIVTKVPRRLRAEAVMSNSFGFGGQNAVAVFTRP
ncbi:beta-ketoacyl-[acyl-carrier-protein] synthase family protein [Streptomyces niveiscabiei]|uniref:Beta-ketoacyl-[acyl-carrier-protein] synthase family protein n=1 Tax=Streptomyces niveiscabiei TaxID=164115 RepID=A0ABW9HH37_9ACTN